MGLEVAKAVTMGGYYFLERDVYVDTNISDEPAASSFSVEDREEGVEKSLLLSTKIHNATLVMESAKSISLPLCSYPNSTQNCIGNI